MVTGSSLTVFYLTRQGRALAERIVRHCPGAARLRFSAQVVKSRWAKGNSLVFIMATGIVVRTIAPFLKDKRIDPAVVVLDEGGEHAISLVSGHLGGANALARDIAKIVGAKPVLTTASDVGNLPALDTWASEQGLEIDEWSLVTRTAGRLVNRGFLKVYSDTPLNLPAAFYPARTPHSADILVSHSTDWKTDGRRAVLFLRPKDLVVGIGCNSGTPAEEIENAVRTSLDEENLSFLSLDRVATIDKKGGEEGLITFAGKHGLPMLTYAADDINRVQGVTPSDAAQKATGAQAVAEPTALLASDHGRLLAGKKKIGNVTVAIAEKKKDEARPGPPARGKGKISVVGTGPGSIDHLTTRAIKAINDAEIIVGYGTYLDLIKALTEGKEVVSTGMAQEIDRCNRAIELAREGRHVAVISGGDPGIFAMAGLVLELLKRETHGSSLPADIEIVPGVSALNASASLLGAPLMHDFAAISLSDRLTPWSTIVDRLNCAAKGDFVIVLYNPRSKGRLTHLEKARDIILAHRSPDTPVGIVRAAMRTGESVTISDLSHMPFESIDMQTTVIVGNSKTFVWRTFMITPRGYEKKRTR